MAMITAFTHSLERTQCLLAHGVRRVIMDHPSVGYRTFADTALPIDGWYAQCVALDSHVEWVAAIDVLLHSRNEAAISAAISAAIRAGVSGFRIQDVALIDWIRSETDAPIMLAPDVGHHSAAAIQYWMAHVDAQSVSNDVPGSVLHTLTDRYRLEVMVQGPILLQWSQRHYLNGFDQPDVWGYDTEYPGRRLRFWRSEHGTAMLAYFHRCLAKDREALEALGVGYWLVDTRGQTDRYLTLALDLYQTCPSPDRVKAALVELETESGCPQRPGFFRGNGTDQDRESPHAGTMLGVIKEYRAGSHVVMQARANGHTHDPVMALTPTQQVKPLSLVGAVTLTGEPVTSFGCGDWLVLPWQKGVVTKSMVLPLEIDTTTACQA